MVERTRYIFKKCNDYVTEDHNILFSLQLILLCKCISLYKLGVSIPSLILIMRFQSMLERKRRLN